MLKVRQKPVPFVQLGTVTDLELQCPLVKPMSNSPRNAFFPRLRISCQKDIVVQFSTVDSWLSIKHHQHMFIVANKHLRPASLPKPNEQLKLNQCKSVETIRTLSCTKLEIVKIEHTLNAKFIPSCLQNNRYLNKQHAIRGFQLTLSPH
jgi:hypothetical protein